MYDNRHICILNALDINFHLKIIDLFIRDILTELNSATSLVLFTKIVLYLETSNFEFLKDVKSYFLSPEIYQIYQETQESYLEYDCDELDEADYKFIESIFSRFDNLIEEKKED